MLNQTDFDNFKKIPHEDVIDIIGTQYIFEYGESKTNDILRKVGESSKLSDIFVRIHIQKRMPAPDEMLNLIHGLSSFIFAKSETVCLAVISFAGQCFKETPDILNEDKVAYIMHIVYKCERMKFNKSDTFYTRVYNRLANEYNSSYY